MIKKSHHDQQNLENEKQLSQHTLCLPVCRISESVQQLMELAIHTLSEAVGSSPQWYVRGITAFKFGTKIAYRFLIDVIAGINKLCCLFLSVQSNFSTLSEIFFTCFMTSCLHITSEFAFLYQYA